jgi:hypothetical protein
MKHWNQNVDLQSTKWQFQHVLGNHLEQSTHAQSILSEPTYIARYSAAIPPHIVVDLMLGERSLVARFT